MKRQSTGGVRQSKGVWQQRGRQAEEGPRRATDLLIILALVLGALLGLALFACLLAAASLQGGGGGGCGEGCGEHGTQDVERCGERGLEGAPTALVKVREGEGVGEGEG